MSEELIPIGEEGYDPETGKTVWWDGIGWSYTQHARPLVPQSRPAHIPLSFAQTRLWFLNQLSSSTPEYNIAQVLRLRGALNVAAIGRAVNTIVGRHESLRTRFVVVNGAPEQVIEDSLEIAINLEERYGLDEQERITVSMEAAKQATREPFDLSRGPLLRVRLIGFDDHDHVLIIVLHHIVSDGWSSSVFNREFALLYDSFCESRENPLAPLPVQYADFAIWQRSRLAGEVLSRGLEYWKRTLAGMPAHLELASDRPRPAVQTFSAGFSAAHLPAERLGALTGLLHANKATLYMALLSAFAVLLDRYTGQSDIVVGTPIANRLDAQLEELIGFFVNSLVMRVKVDRSLTFRQLLAQVQTTTLDAYDHQDIPFERIVAELSPERSLNSTPLFQMVFALQNAPSRSQSLHGIEIQPMAVEEIHARFDLDVNVIEGGSGLGFYWLYNRDLFDSWRIDQMARHYVQLIENVSANPDIPLSRLAILSDADQRQVLDAFNPALREVRPATVVRLFEEQVARTPEAVALVRGHERVSYRLLNARANRLAHHLIGMGVGPETFVGICVDRSVEMLVGLLAVLKAGAAYLPLDPTYPEARLQYMVADASPRLILSSAALRSRFTRVAQVIPLDDLDVRNTLARFSDRDPVDAERTAALLSRHPAYIIYTSGSTGKPKGVVIEHRSIVTFAAWAGSVYTAEEWSGVLASTSICFDLSIFELLLTPIHGGTIILADSAVDLPELPARDQVRLINTVPSAAQSLVELDAIPASVRTVNLCGEILRHSLVEGLYDFPHIERVYNLYGPTEDTTYSTFTLCPRDATEDPDIGVPLWNTRAYVLDSDLQPSPLGVEGDLYLSGAGIARGYHRRPGLTAERFPADPHGAPGERMYRTGDRARRRVDGTLEFRGRLDHQVKIRGYRVEPGEIEAVLREQAGVAQQAVIARDDGPAGTHLVAYIALHEGFSPDATALRRALAGRLPDYMVPSAFEFLPALPQTPNGKLDRAALPAPRGTGNPQALDGALPVSAMEHKVASIWREVLKVERVGIHDNFFEIGGNSLLLITVLAKLRKQVRLEITALDLFRYPKISSLAAFLEQAQTRQPEVQELVTATGSRSPGYRVERQKQAIQQRAAGRAKSRTASAQGSNS